MEKLNQFILGTIALGLTTTVQAENWADRIQVNGFASAVIQGTSEQAYFNGEASEEGVNEDISFQGTRVGLTVSTKITDRLNFAAQFTAIAEESYDVHYDWLFGAFAFGDNFTVRAGAMKFPVGIINEYRDVGYALPWIAPPVLLYTDIASTNGMANTVTSPNATRESYSGASLLFNKEFDDWTVIVDLFGGGANGEGGETPDLRKLRGISATLNWDDTLLLTASSSVSVMRNAPAGMTAMNGKEHEVTSLGAKLDWNELFVYAESFDVEMEGLTMMSSESWYTTVGYHITPRWAPYYSYQEIEFDNNLTEQNMQTLGVRYELMKNTALKLEFSDIETPKGNGLFDDSDTNDPFDRSSVKMYGIAVDYLF
ncbi:MAG: porin [Gammaproteobacteria bacterium]|nr:porin [Gammaproteobacteria bacterium]